MCIRQRYRNPSRITDLGLKPTGRARQQGDPNVPNQPSQGGQDVDYFPNDLMQYWQYSMSFLTTTWTKCKDMQRIWYVFQTHPALRTCAVLCKSGMNTCLRDRQATWASCAFLWKYTAWFQWFIIIFPVKQPQLRPTEAFSDALGDSRVPLGTRAAGGCTTMNTKRQRWTLTMIRCWQWSKMISSRRTGSVHPSLQPPKKIKIAGIYKCYINPKKICKNRFCLVPIS